MCECGDRFLPFYYIVQHEDLEQYYSLVSVRFFSCAAETMKCLLIISLIVFASEGLAGKKKQLQCSNTTVATA